MCVHTSDSSSPLLPPPHDVPAEGATVKTSLTPAVDPWWPHGDKGGFFNVGLRNWNIVRSDWKKRPANLYVASLLPLLLFTAMLPTLSHTRNPPQLPVPCSKRPPRPPIVGLADIMDGLSHLCRTYELPSRIALPDMIDIFIDIWDDADL